MIRWSCLNRHYSTSVILTVVLFACTIVQAQPQFHPQLQISRTSGKIEIDGSINDRGWENVKRMSGFVERNPGDNLAPDVSTEFLVTFDDNALYVAYICHDTPAGIRATMSQRDQYSGDDAIVLLIDTYGTASVAYELFVNPYGVQKDALWTSVGSEDYGFDLLWESAAKITSDGWVAELALPFSSLRFPDQSEQTWRVDFWRNRPRQTFKQYSWAANDRNEQCWPCQWGTMTGIRDVEPGKGIEILPSLVASQTGNLNGFETSTPQFENGNPKGQLSLGGKYALSSTATIEATVNPDFSQIEADAAQIDVNSTIALMYPERRPFFQEGSDIFRTLFNSFYTRTINDPLFAAKLTGRTEKNTFGVLSAYEENTPYIIPLTDRSLLFNSKKSTANVFRFSRSLGNDSRLGMILTDRRWDGGGSGTVGAIDGDFRLSKSFSLIGQYIGTHTREPGDSEINPFIAGLTFDDGKHTMALDKESYYGTGTIVQLHRQARHLNFTVNYDHVSPSYRTETGFDPLNDYRNLSLYTQYTFYTKSGLIERITPRNYSLKRWFWNGNPKASVVNSGADVQFRFAQTSLSFNYNRDTEHYRGINFDRLWRASVFLYTRPTAAVGFNVNVQRARAIARFAMREMYENSVDFSVNLKPIDRLIIESGISYAGADDRESNELIYDGYISRTRVLLQVTKALSLRLVGQYDKFEKSWDVDPLFTYRVSPFSVLYVGSSSNYAFVDYYEDAPSKWRLVSRQFFMKLQYLFQT